MISLSGKSFCLHISYLTSCSENLAGLKSNFFIEQGSEAIPGQKITSQTAHRKNARLQQRAILFEDYYYGM